MKKNKLDIIEDSVKVVILPDSNGFTIAMIDAVQRNMSNEKYELIMTLARGLIDMARKEPDKVFRRGMRAFAEDRKETLPKTNIVDFLEHLKKKRNEGQFMEEEILDPF